MSMNVNQIKMYKEQAQKEILEIIERVEQYTDCDVYDLDLQNRFCGSDRKVTITLRIK